MINSDTPDILKDIVELKRVRVEERKKSLSMLQLEDLISKAERPLNFSGRLMGDEIRVIAEVKRASPSKGIFKKALDAANLARTYAENG
ncbi:MAG: indole-3-glycerol-phosphate synthase TrpC, partial [Chloroflexota bacterium]|nr:indole-3-glycerol-phosphate synthase TrpC [Chloroflexota bacterium]